MQLVCGASQNFSQAQSPNALSKVLCTQGFGQRGVGSGAGVEGPVTVRIVGRPVHENGSVIKSSQLQGSRL